MLRLLTLIGNCHWLRPLLQVLLPMRRHASVVFVVIVCPSVCLSVSVTIRSCTKMAEGKVSCKQCCTIAQRLQLYVAKDVYEIRMGSPQTRVPNAGGVGKKFF